MIQLPFVVQSRLQAARLTPEVVHLIQQECDQQGYLLHPTAIKGTGGFGVVFQAEDAAGETVAIKVSVPRPGMEALFAAMCEEEGRKACALAGLPHIAAGIEYWFAPQADLFFLVSRFVAGSDLKAYLQRVPGAIAEARLRTWALQLTEALSVMHARGLVHRDVKPENILLEQATDQVYLADLGVAKYLDQGTLEQLSTTGTHPYAPREQILGSTTSKSDQYALGIVLFELTTGIGALPPVAVPRLGYPVARPEWLEPQRYNRALSADFAACIERLAANKPADRFASMQVAHEALGRMRRVLPRQCTEPMEPPSAPERSPASMRAVALACGADLASVPARPSFAWRPFWQLRLALLGGSIHLGGPELSRGGVVWLMVLYLCWTLAAGWGIASTWAALSGQGFDAFWLLVGTVAVVVWRMVRTWNMRGVTRRGSLSASQRRHWTLVCLGWLLIASLGVMTFWLGFPAPIWAPAWLETIGGWAIWLVLYVSIEIWLN